MTENMTKQDTTRLYDKLDAITLGLAEIKTAIALIQQTQDFTKEVYVQANSRIAVLEEKMNKLEAFRTRLRYYGTMGAIVGFFILDIIKSYISKIF